MCLGTHYSEALIVSAFYVILLLVVVLLILYVGAFDDSIAATIASMVAYCRVNADG